MQQRVCGAHIRGVRQRRLQAVRQPQLRIHSDRRLHPEIPLLALPRLAHLRNPLAGALLRQRRRGNDARIHNRPRLQPVPQQGQVRLDLLQQRLAQTVLLQPVAAVQNRRLVRQPTRQPQAHEAAYRLHLVEQILHPRVAQVVESLHTVHAQHRPQRIGPATASGLRIKRLDTRFQTAPRKPARPSSPETPRAASGASSCRVPAPQTSPVPSRALPLPLPTLPLHHDRCDLFRPSLIMVCEISPTRVRRRAHIDRSQHRRAPCPLLPGAASARSMSSHSVETRGAR